MTEEIESFEEFKANLDKDNSTEPNTESQPTEPVTANADTDNSVNPAEENSPAIDPEEYNKTKKSYEELQSVFGRQGKELGELRKFKEEFTPYLDYLKQIEQAQKQQQYEENPDLKYQDMIQQELAPYRERMIDMETTETVNQLQTELGEEAYNTLAPIMANVLAYYSEHQPQKAKALAEDPAELVRIAAGDYHLWQMQQQRSASTQEAQARPQVNPQRQKQAQSMAGTAKSKSSSQRTQGDMSQMDLNEMREHLRKLGVAQRITE